jgi:hypothetical protein
MQIRRALMAGTAAAMATMAVLGTATAATAAPAAKHHDVLTTGKVGGTNVKDKAVLKASLKKGTSAVFKSGAMTLTCTTSTFKDKVTKNPTAKGTADESVTSETVGKCTVTGVTGITVQSVKIGSLPYKSTVSDKKGDPVTVDKPSTTITVVVSGITNPVVCIYNAKKITGSASNKHQTISFKNQTFTLDKSTSNGLCTPDTGKFTATYGPVEDTSVKHDPKVYVN